MTPWTCTVTKLKSADGFWELQEGHELATVGTEVEIDLDSRRTQKFANRPTGKNFECEIVDIIQPGLNGQILPVELLDL